VFIAVLSRTPLEIVTRYTLTIHADGAIADWHPLAVGAYALREQVIVDVCAAVKALFEENDAASMTRKDSRGLVVLNTTSWTMVPVTTQATSGAWSAY